MRCNRLMLLSICLLVNSLGASWSHGQSLTTPQLPFLEKRMPHGKLSAPPISESFNTDRLIVKFKDESGIRVTGTTLGSVTGADVSFLLGVLVAHPEIRFSKVILQDEDSIDEERRILERQHGREFPDVNTYVIFERSNHTAVEAGAFFYLLNALDVVEIAYFEAKNAPPPIDIPPTTPNFQGQQGYLAAAPSGIDALYAWTIAGGKGAGISFIDIEYSWRLTHEDFKSPFVSFTVTNPAYGPGHGTSVLGELVAQQNGYGMTGIVPDAAFGVISQQYFGFAEVGAANAVSQAKNLMSPGDVIVLEVQWGPPASCGGINPVPAESQPLIYDQIVLATGKGIVVVAAAGNGAWDLDAQCFGGNFNRQNRDSGAIIVGAGTSGSRSPLSFTNYGSRLDLQGWGQNVASTSTDNYSCPITHSGASDLNQQYTSCFDGTSSATPIVAGAAIAIQGIQKARNGRVLTPKQARDVLVANGTAQATSNKNIGPLPSLQGAISWLVADTDQDGMSNGDELSVGRNVLVDERALLFLMGDD